jgi:transposase
MTTLADRLLPEQLWQRIQPLLPLPPSHARGGAPRTVSDRACMAAIIFMARTSTHWALLPVGEFGCGSVTTCWRRFAEWAAAGVFERLQELLLDELGQAGALDWSRISVDSFSLRAVRGTCVAQTRSIGPSPGPSCTWPLRVAGCRCRCW